MLKILSSFLHSYYSLRLFLSFSSSFSFHSFYTFLLSFPLLSFLPIDSLFFTVPPPLTFLLSFYISLLLFSLSQPSSHPLFFSLHFHTVSPPSVLPLFYPASIFKLLFLPTFFLFPRCVY